VIQAEPLHQFRRRANAGEEQVETMLQGTEANTPQAPRTTADTQAQRSNKRTATESNMGPVWDGIDTVNSDHNERPAAAPLEDLAFDATMNMNMNMNLDNMGGDFSWDMIGLGLEEPLPPQETIDQLHQVYFDTVHPSIPMVHKSRYLMAMNL
jgi:hypothetical protein